MAEDTWKKKMSWNQNNPDANNEPLPSGHTRREYYDAGFSEMDIEYWGLDQPGAPDPLAAGFLIMDVLDGDFDGDGEPDL